MISKSKVLIGGIKEKPSEEGFSGCFVGEGYYPSRFISDYRVFGRDNIPPLRCNDN